ETVLAYQEPTSGRAALTVNARRPGGLILRWEGLEAPWIFSCHQTPKREGSSLHWDTGVEMEVSTGTLAGVTAEALVPNHAVGNGRLALIDPMPMKYPLIEIAPDPEGRIRLEIRTQA